MATVDSSPKAIHSPSTTTRMPKGILKNSYQKSPPESPVKEKDMSEKELTIVNTQANAGHRRSSSAASRPPGSRRQSERTPSTAGGDGDESLPPSQRLQWDEANLYLTEQERTSTMKITEPKTPYARHYEPSEDDLDDNDLEMADGGEHSQREEIPGLSLGEPEEDVPENEFSASKKKESKVHVSDEDATPLHDAENEYLGMTPEEREKHRKFEELRKKHYEMKGVAQLLGHPEDIDDLPDDN
ncbi:hypothetical protein F5Y16DRAFT_332634 [Xylariaceae sp. FL0255]|nr:hypothetical protein F5Y16DRAFT_332634 [Xylariaceae sp. FL0255]